MSLLAAPAWAVAPTISSFTPAAGVASTVSTAVPTLSLAPASGPPKSTTTVSGTNFGANEDVDVYFDSTATVPVTTTSTGSGTLFPVTVQVPAGATPGSHTVRAIGRRTRLFAQSVFTVRTNWASFRNGAHHKGVNPYENVLSTTNVAGLGLDWTATTGSFVESSPAVANGVVYVGSLNSKVYALNAITGAVLWTAKTGGHIESSPAVANGVVYVGSFNPEVYALNATTGAVLWTATTGSYVSSSPAVANGVVYVGSTDSNVYAFDLDVTLSTAAGSLAPGSAV